MINISSDRITSAILDFIERSSNDLHGRARTYLFQERSRNTRIALSTSGRRYKDVVFDELTDESAEDALRSGCNSL